MMRLLTLSIVAGLFAGELPAQAEKKSAPTKQAVELARLRQQVEKLTAENKKLKAQNQRKRAGTIGRLIAPERREAAPIRQFKVADLKVAAPARVIEWKAVDRVVLGGVALRGVEGRLTWAGAIDAAAKDRYAVELGKLNAARKELGSAVDDDAALRAIDNFSKALMEVRAELWKRKEAAKKKGNKKTVEKDEKK